MDAGHAIRRAGPTLPATASATSEGCVRGACPLCGCSGGRVRMAEAGYVGRGCTCGTIYIDPVPASTAVDPTVDAHLDSYYALPARLRFSWASRFAPGRRFLDVGCGSGAMVRIALGSGFEVQAVEPNVACAGWVASRYLIDVERATIETSKLPADQFDLIYHVDLLSHFPDPVRALEAMAARLRPGGALCFEVGLFADLNPAWYPWVGRPHFPAHRCFYSEVGIARLLEQAGLEIVGTRQFAIAPSTILSSLLRRLLPPRIESVPPEAIGLPSRGTTVQRLYAWLHFVLRYRLGAWAPFPGPRTAFFAARVSA